MIIILISVIASIFSANKWGIYGADPKIGLFSQRVGGNEVRGGDFITVGSLDGGSGGVLYKNSSDKDYDPNRLAYYYLLRSIDPEYGATPTLTSAIQACTHAAAQCGCSSSNIAGCLCVNYTTTQWVLGIFTGGFYQAVTSTKCALGEVECGLKTYSDVSDCLLGAPQALAQKPLIAYKTPFDGIATRADAYFNDFLTGVGDFNYSIRMGTIASALSVSPQYAYKRDMLNKQIELERTHALEAIEAEIDYRHLHNLSDSILIQIANEPNMFPYIPPELYAEYYANWVYEIKQGISTWAAGKSYKLAFMPGGLYDSDAMPDNLKNFFANGVHLYYLGFKLGVSQVVSEQAYYATFLNTLTAYLAKLNKSDKVEDLIDYGNLHLYPCTWSFTNSGVSSYLTPDNSNWPNLRAQYASNIDFVASRSRNHKVLITEFGNITPFDQKTVIDNVQTPLVKFLSTNTQVLRAYWYLSASADPKFKKMHSMPFLPELLIKMGAQVGQSFTSALTSDKVVISAAAQLAATVEPSLTIGTTVATAEATGLTVASTASSVGIAFIATDLYLDNPIQILNMYNFYVAYANSINSSKNLQTVDGESFYAPFQSLSDDNGKLNPLGNNYVRLTVPMSPISNQLLLK